MRAAFRCAAGWPSSSCWLSGSPRSDPRRGADPAPPHRAFLETCEQLALQLMTAAAFASVMLLAVGRWALVATLLLVLVLGNSSSGGAMAAVGSAAVRAHLPRLSARATHGGIGCPDSLRFAREADQGDNAPTVLTRTVSLRTPVTNKNEPDRPGRPGRWPRAKSSSGSSPRRPGRTPQAMSQARTRSWSDPVRRRSRRSTSAVRRSSACACWCRRRRCGRRRRHVVIRACTR
jgi:hypothetical protein